MGACGVPGCAAELASVLGRPPEQVSPTFQQEAGQMRSAVVEASCEL